MLTITVGNELMQDVSWGGPRSLPVAGTERSRAGARWEAAVRENALRMAECPVSRVSLRLFGLIEITQTRAVRRGG